MKYVTLLFACLAAYCAAAQNTASAAARSGNPVFPGWYADPEGVVFGDTYWIYPTYSADYDEQTFLDAFSSKDLVHWQKHPRIVSNDEVKWVKRAMWAPAAVHTNGSAMRWASRSSTASSTGPSPSTSSSSATTTAATTCTTAAGGTATWYACRRICCVSCPSTTAPSTRRSPPRITPRGRSCSGAYAIADSPFGTFERIGKILEQDPAIACGAGHHSVIQVPGRDEWYIVYHRRPLNETAASSRETCIDRMYFDAEGHIVPVRMTRKGVEARPIPAAGKAR